jgi:hypothetical protein
MTALAFRLDFPRQSLALACQAGVYQRRQQIVRICRLGSSGGMILTPQAMSLCTISFDFGSTAFRPSPWCEPAFPVITSASKSGADIGALQKSLAMPGGAFEQDFGAK